MLRSRKILSDGQDMSTLAFVFLTREKYARNPGNEFAVETRVFSSNFSPENEKDCQGFWIVLLFIGRWIETLRGKIIGFREIVKWFCGKHEMDHVVRIDGWNEQIKEKLSVVFNQKSTNFVLLIVRPWTIGISRQRGQISAWIKSREKFREQNPSKWWIKKIATNCAKMPRTDVGLE